MISESELALIDSIRDYSVLFVGDTIIDEYHYVKPMGKSPKENIIPVQHMESETFDGGTHAAANHLRTFCRKVNVCTGGYPVRKVRMVDKTYLRKLSEIHYLCGFREPDALQEADITVVTDFGHGFVNQQMIASLMTRQFLAVAAQTNSSNVGFNLITKYPRADYIVIDEPEARLAAADRDSPIKKIMEKLAAGRCRKFVVTHGRFGSYGYDDGEFYHCDAFTDRIVDTMGAGDAFFAVTAPMAKTGHMRDLLRIGNSAGALKTQIVGHRKSVTKDALIEYLKANG